MKRDTVSRVKKKRASVILSAAKNLVATSTSAANGKGLGLSQLIVGPAVQSYPIFGSSCGIRSSSFSGSYVFDVR